MTALSEVVVDTVTAPAVLTRRWALRDRFSGYAAAYVATAELLESPLLSAETRFVGDPFVWGKRARPQVIEDELPRTVWRSIRRGLGFGEVTLVVCADGPLEPAGGTAFGQVWIVPAQEASSPRYSITDPRLFSISRPTVDGCSEKIEA